jgi:hypothetical protein
MNGISGFNFIDNVLINNQILSDIETLHQDYYNVSSSYLLSQQFEIGSPVHPSNPAGHFLAGHCMVVFLKCYFNGNTLWQDLPRIADGTKRVTNESGASTFIVAQANSDGTDLVNYTGSIANMTVNSELNKLASNVALGRDTAGVHYRSDGDGSDLLKMAEDITISYVKNILSTYTQNYGGTQPVVTLERFDGTTIQITPDLSN